MTNEWKIAGTYFDSCNCSIPCPCVFLSPPNEEDCTLLVGWHIEQGNFGDVTLDGLNVALAVYAPGHMPEVEWKVALYLDETADQAQNEALTQIFAGQAGGHPARLAQHIGEVLGVASVAMEYQADEKRRSMRFGDVGEFEIEAIEGQGGAEVTVSNPPFCIAPGYPFVTSKSKKLSYNDHGYQWELSDKNGYFSPFTYQGD